MIRTLDIICSECGEKFIPDGKLYYRDNFISSNIRDVGFICPACIGAWKEKWQIRSAGFHEQDYVMTVDIALADGTVYEKLDCTPIDESGTVVVGEDIPEEAQKKLYEIYHAWDTERKAHVLKDCIFKDEFMRTSVTLETYGGEKFEDVAFRVNRRGELETEVPLPDYIKKQVLEAYALYEAQDSD